MDDGDTRVVSDEGVEIPLMGSQRDQELTRKVLRDWLGRRLGAEADFAVSPITLPSGTGVANETLLFDATWSSGGTDRHEGFVARLAVKRSLYLDADIEVHAKIYEALADVADVPVPRVFGYEADPELLGAPFFVMERMHGDVPGDAPHWSTAGFIFDATRRSRAAMWEDAVRVLAALHRVQASKFAFLLPDNGLSGLEDHLRYWRRSLDHRTAESPHDGLDEDTSG